MRGLLLIVIALLIGCGEGEKDVVATRDGALPTTPIVDELPPPPMPKQLPQR